MPNQTLRRMFSREFWPPFARPLPPLELFDRDGEPTLRPPRAYGEPRWGNKLRFEILQRDGYRCQYCGREGKGAQLEVDHVLPRSRGGSNHHHNLVTACLPCNQGKKAGAAPHPVTMARPQLVLTDDQEYTRELLGGAHWCAVWRREHQIAFESALNDEADLTFELEEEFDGNY